MCGICPGSGLRYSGGVRARDYLMDYSGTKRGAIEKGYPAFARQFNNKRGKGTYRTKMALNLTPRRVGWTGSLAFHVFFVTSSQH